MPCRRTARPRGRSGRERRAHPCLTPFWRRTWPDDEPKPDFLAQEPGYSFAAGRIFRADTHPSPDPKPWRWSLTGPHMGRQEIGETDGLAATKAQAIRRVAKAWERAKAWSARTGEPMRWGTGADAEEPADRRCLGTRWRGA